MSGSRISPVAALAGKSRLAITLPWTNDFLEPQNTATIWSAREKLSARLRPQMMPNTSR